MLAKKCIKYGQKENRSRWGISPCRMKKKDNQKNADAGDPKPIGMDREQNIGSRTSLVNPNAPCTYMLLCNDIGMVAGN